MSRKLHFTEARHDVLRTAADGRLEWHTGLSGTGAYWAQLPGMAEDDRTTTPRLDAAATALTATGHLRHVNPSRMRSGKVEITELGIAALRYFEAHVAARNANA
jgi:hypothetical protein